MNNDLISREALKEKIENLIGYSLSYEAILNAIDNAPTVEAIPTELHEKILNETIGELLECQSNLRPQGEWIFKHNSSDIWCSVCDENFDEIPQKFRYCPNCGADMRGKQP